MQPHRVLVIFVLHHLDDEIAVHGTGRAVNGFDNVDSRRCRRQRGVNLALKNGSLLFGVGPVDEEDAVEGTGLHGFGFDFGQRGCVG